MSVFDKITAQQEGLTGTPAWMVGMQLRDLLLREPALQPIVDEDLSNPDMSLSHCAEQLQTYADKNHGKQECFCITPDVAEGIIRKFYGLPDASGSQPEPTPATAEEADDFLSLEDFL